MGMDKMDSIATKTNKAKVARRKSRRFTEEPDELSKLPKIKGKNRRKLAIYLFKIIYEFGINQF
jgi:hypothetical protein